MIVVDVETTGLDPKKHSILSIGAIDLENPDNTFYIECQIRDRAEVTDEALWINGFTKEEIKDKKKKTVKEAVEEFIEWTTDIEDRTIAGGNPAFDRDFIKESAELYDLDYKFSHRTVDLHSIAYSHYLKRGEEPPRRAKRTGLNVDKILNYVGLPDEPRPHNALIGAKIEAEAFSRLIYGEKLFKEYKKYKLPSYLKD